jgi:DNA end-binding protein Ku
VARAKTKSSAPSKHRASWHGQLSFGLVSFPVEAFNALDREKSDIHFHQIHASCHNRIKYQKVCPRHGVVTNDEIVSGYEHKKGQFVHIDPDELDALRSERDRALKIEAFVRPDAIDPLYFDGRMYYLAPEGPEGHEPYSVIAEAMDREGRCGVGQVAFSGKDQIVLIRPYEGILHMAMLNYESEIRPPASVVHSLRRPSGIARHVRLAQTLIEEWSDDKFDFSRYTDPHREKVEELIKAKIRGRKIVEPDEEEEAPRILNLMDALKKSVGAHHSNGKPSRRPRRRSA